jgi:hypothetical protein
MLGLQYLMGPVCVLIMMTRLGEQVYHTPAAMRDNDGQGRGGEE